MKNTKFHKPEMLISKPIEKLFIDGDTYLFSKYLTDQFNEILGGLLLKVFVQVFGLEIETSDDEMDQSDIIHINSILRDNCERQKLLLFKNGSLVELQFSDFGGLVSANTK